RVTGLDCVRVQWHRDGDGRTQMVELSNSAFHIPAELVLLAMGFLHPVKPGAVEGLGLALDQCGNIKANTENYRTSIDKVFAAGDARRGQSLVVWAIREGRQCARAVDEFLMGKSDLPR
ncbi:MAG: FAD-dependent oxidoreductase, partial [Alphaproteobacteria bacterium]|nr:FAD-dependent oxidoreductase [Alphaproteobacteria bacterium]